jgi:hypothetical protein
VAGDDVIAAHINRLRLRLGADVAHPGASGPEPAVGRRVNGTGDIPLKDYLLGLFAPTGSGYGREEGLGIRMQGPVEELVDRGHLD